MNGVDKLFGHGPQEWLDALSERSEAFNVWIFEQKDNPKSHKARDALRALWTTEAHLLYQFVYLSNKNGVPPKPFPASELLWMQSMAEDLGRGIISDTIENARSSGGGRPTLRWERREIAKAILFLEAQKRGEIECDSPVAVVARCFGVSMQAVRKWQKRPEFYCRDVEPPHPNLLMESMRNAGIRYSLRGRGTAGS